MEQTVQSLYIFGTARVLKLTMSGRWRSRWRQSPPRPDPGSRLAGHGAPLDGRGSSDRVAVEHAASEDSGERGVGAATGEDELMVAREDRERRRLAA
jgi:hypothetical protein